MFIYCYSIVCLDFFPWGGGFFDTFDQPFVSHPGEFDKKKFQNLSNPHPLPALPLTGFTLIGALKG